MSLLEGLSALEYRGYDSAGVSVFTENGLQTVKSAGRLAVVAGRLASHPLPGCCGISHTRWATHGEPSDANAHPHGTARLSLVHNGIIENYAELKMELSAQGYTFETQTDTEVAAKLLDSCYQGDPIEAIRTACAKMEVPTLSASYLPTGPGEVYGTRLNSPLLAAVGEGEGFLASDISAVLQYTKQYYTLDHGEIVTISPDGTISICTMDGEPVQKEMLTAQWSVEQAQKNGYEHFMRKEIFEQPTALYNTVHPRIAKGLPDFTHDGIAPGFFRDVTRIQMVACGTASYAGFVGKNVIEKLAWVPAEVDIASEFRYRDPILDPTQLVVVISQSGETADTLAALRLAKKSRVSKRLPLSMWPVPPSPGKRTLSCIPMPAGDRRSQHQSLLGANWRVVPAGHPNRYGKRPHQRGTGSFYVDRLQEAIELTHEALKADEKAKELSAILKDMEDLFFIGRGANFPLCREGSLKAQGDFLYPQRSLRGRRA